MKKSLSLLAALVAVVFSANAVEFAYDAGAEIVSTYIWRGLYNGGLSFQPDVEIGYDGKVDFARDFSQGSVRLESFDFPALGIDGNNLAFVIPNEINEDVVADAALFRRRANYGDRLWIKNTVDISESFFRQHLRTLSIQVFYNYQ